MLLAQDTMVRTALGKRATTVSKPDVVPALNDLSVLEGTHYETVYT